MSYNNTIISKDPLDYFKNLFDKVIDEDNESEELFRILVLKNGTKTIYLLTKLLNYEDLKTKILFNKAFKICTMMLFDKTNYIKENDDIRNKIDYIDINTINKNKNKNKNKNILFGVFTTVCMINLVFINKFIRHSKKYSKK
jgi:hypothetical protein